uniref:Transposase Tc1-like domain-containing protein n=1 Tax=Lates calcarifer TaxID=8187 RepID=A0A4W6EZN1_LATCA
MSIETKERIIKLLKEGKSSRSVAKDVGCSQSAVSKIWTKYKQHGKVVKGKHTGRPRKTSKRQDRKLKAICLENRKCTAKQMRNKWEETGVNVCDRTVRNRLKEMGFTYRKAKRKPSLTPKQKKTRLQWAKENQKERWKLGKEELKLAEMKDDNKDHVGIHGIQSLSQTFSSEGSAGT